MGRRKVTCRCGCGKPVTLETQKAHLQGKHMRRKVSLTRLHSNQRRISTQDSIRAHRAHSSVHLPSNIPPNDQFHDDEPMFASDDPPDADLTAIWSEVARSTQRRPIDLADVTSTQESVPEDFKSATDSDRSAGYWQEEEHPTFNAGMMHQRFLIEARRIAPHHLSPESLVDIKVFDYIIKHRLSVRAYDAMQDEFVHKSLPHMDLPSLKRLRTRILKLSAMPPTEYHCCKNSCVCFTGYLEELDECPYCSTPRFNAAGAPQATFQYIPLIPQLLALFCNRETCETLLYRSNYKSETETIEDIFDGGWYRQLCETFVTIDGVRQPYKFFSDDHELALGLSVDGMCPFKRRKHSCWPLIIINFNLPPEVRTHLDNIICIGVVPGPHSPKDLNSFLQPLVSEMLDLAKGIEAVDMLNEQVFSLRAHLILGFGDIPALTKILEFLGHNARFPCRFCLIQGVSGYTANGGTHLYCPLHRPRGASYNPLDLPLRTHEDTIRLGNEVLEERTDHARSTLASQSGVKGISILAQLPSISIPRSFPAEVMHMVWINLMPQLADLWTEKFNGIGQGKEKYGMHPKLWDAIGDLGEDSGATYSSSFGCRVPHLKKRSNFTAESWSTWGSSLAPNLLRRRFRNRTYYTHFVQLIKLMKECTDYSMERKDLPRIREGFANWIKEYERIYYQYKSDRLQTCTVNVHYLLHIADSIEFMGPVWCYWAYPMERFCSFIGASVKSRRFPYANINQRVCDVAQLRIIRELYNLHHIVKFGQTRASTDEVLAGELESANRFKEYPTILFLTPRSELLDLSQEPFLHKQIIKYLVTAFSVTSHDLKKVIPDDAKLQQWGRIRMTGGGDLIHARAYHKLRSDGRDASFVRYELLVDRLAHRPRAKPQLGEKSYYGQLQRIFAIDIPPCTRKINPSKTDERTLVLAFIQEADAERSESCGYPVVWYEDSLGSGEVVDANSVQCTVGRIQDDKRWWIIDRSSKLAYPVFT